MTPDEPGVEARWRDERAQAAERGKRRHAPGMHVQPSAAAEVKQFCQARTGSAPDRARARGSSAGRGPATRPCGSRRSLPSCHRWRRSGHRPGAVRVRWRRRSRRHRHLSAQTRPAGPGWSRMRRRFVDSIRGSLVGGAESILRSASEASVMSRPRTAPSTRHRWPGRNTRRGSAQARTRARRLGQQSESEVVPPRQLAIQPRCALSDRATRRRRRTTTVRRRSGHRPPREARPSVRSSRSDGALNC